MIEIQVGSTSDENNKLNKTFNIRTTVNAEIFTPFSIENPKLIFSSDAIQSTDNYFYIPDYDRYYFKTETETTGDITTVGLAVDVLMSFKEEIKNCPLIAERSSNIYNGYLIDSERQFLNKTVNQFINLGTFSGETLYLYGVG